MWICLVPRTVEPVMFGLPQIGSCKHIGLLQAYCKKEVSIEVGPTGDKTVEKANIETIPVH